MSEGVYGVKRACEACKGERFVLVDGVPGPCGACDGRGAVPMTEAQVKEIEDKRRALMGASIADCVRRGIAWR